MRDGDDRIVHVLRLRDAPEFSRTTANYKLLTKAIGTSQGTARQRGRALCQDEKNSPGPDQGGTPILLSLSGKHKTLRLFTGACDAETGSKEKREMVPLFCFSVVGSFTYQLG